VDLTVENMQRVAEFIDSVDTGRRF